MINALGGKHEISKGVAKKFPKAYIGIFLNLTGDSIVRIAPYSPRSRLIGWRLRDIKSEARARHKLCSSRPVRWRPAGHGRYS